MIDATSVGSIVAAVAFVGLLALFILLPLLRGRSSTLDSDPKDLREEDARRKALLFALRDVEYDYATGKLDDRDYRSLKSELSKEALAVLDAPATGVARGPAELEAEILAIRQGLREGTTCRGCARVNDPESRFCSQCGSSLGSA